MNRIARMSARERADIFAETADRKNLSGAIVEKDFWVCWILKQLFSIDALSNRLLFKGGTSLSKIFHAINRFSEDIDLAVDYVPLGFVNERDPRLEGISRTRRNAILDEMMIACQRYIAGDFIDALRLRCQQILGAREDWSLVLSDSDPNIVGFRYPSGGAQKLDYIRQQVLLELGTHAEFVPHDRFTIRSFVIEEFTNLDPEGDVIVDALLAKRTFWEKATILHAEYYRPLEKALPDRYSRHYYDLAALATGPIRDEALDDLELLDQVVRHKQIFYASAWARYDLAKVGSLRLAPPDNRLRLLQSDYRSMGAMIFGEPPDFNQVMTTLTGLEQEINQMT